MSIEVHCPNPDCAKVHRVKNRWAGRRGTCPDCGTIIKVPVNGMAMKHKAVETPEPDPLDEEAAAAAALAGADDALDDWDAPPKKKPVADDVDEDADEKPVRARDDEDEEEEAVPSRDDEDEDEEPALKRKAAALADDEDEEPVRARDEDEDDEPAPKRKAAALDADEDEDEDRITKRGRDEEDEDEEPAPKRKAAALDDDEEEEPVSARDEDDEDEKPTPKRKAAAFDDDDEEPVQAQEEDEDEEPRPKKRAAALDDDEDGEAVPARDEDDEDEPRPKKKPARRGRDDDEDFDDEAKPAASGRRFGLLLILVYLLATLSILGVFTLSFVEPVQIFVNGKAVKEGPERVSLLRSVNLEEPKGTDSAEIKTVLLSAPIGTAVLSGLALLVSILKRNFGLLALIIAYLVVIPCWAMSILLGIARMARDQSHELIKSHFSQRPDVTVSDPSSIWFWVGLGSAVAATLLFGLAILLIHRRTWARIVSAILAVLAWGGGAAFVIFGKNL